MSAVPVPGSRRSGRARGGAARGRAWWTRVGVLLVWLTVVWVALWGDVTLANVLAGLGLGAAILVVFPVRTPAEPVWVRPVAVVRFVALFVWLLILANLTVVLAVLRPRRYVREGILAVDLAPAPRGVLVLVADAVTLTPGTLSIDLDLDPPVLYVHALTASSPASIRADVLKLERAALAAFGPPGSTAAVDRLLAALEEEG